MGIRDALRSFRSGEKGLAEVDSTDVQAPEPTWFQPRCDGSYRVAGTEPTTTETRQLRFLPAGGVSESNGADTAEGTEELNPCSGEYTGAGRFSVQRRFERIVSYAVLEMDVGGTAVGGTQGRPGFRARRTDSADRSTAEFHFQFHPDDV